MLRSWSQWRHRKIMDVRERPRSGPRVTGKLMNGGKGDPRIVRHDVLRAVAMMRIEVPDRDPFRAILQRIERCHRDVAEITEAHRAFPHRVMSRRAHQAEGRNSFQRLVPDVEGGARRAQRMFLDFRISGCVRIEWLR